jgi:uncharacterized protein involved in exopolysaccharide biosynthesis
MEEIYFRDVVQFLWRSKWWVAGTTTLSVAVAVWLYAHAIPQYQTTMTLVPVMSGQNPWEQGAQGAASLASQFLGVSVGDRSIQKSQQFLSLFRSPTVLERADKQLSLLQHLFSRSWDEQRQTWIEPTGWRTTLRTMLRTDLPYVPPSLSDGAKYLERTMTVTPLSGGTIVEVRFTDRDPKFSVPLLEALYRESDEVMRNRARLQNDEHINYIQKALPTVSYAETRQSLTTLLTAEVGQRIMINSSSPYAMEILKPPLTDPRPVSPVLTSHVLAGIAVGFVGGLAMSAFFATLLRHRRPRRRVLQSSPVLSSVPGGAAALKS